MTQMLIAQGVTIALVIIGFIGNIMYFKGVFTEKVDNIKEDIKDLKSSVRYSDTCESMHDGLDQRIKILEGVRNGR